MWKKTKKIVCNSKILSILLFKCYIFHSTSIAANPDSYSAYINFREVVTMSKKQSEININVAF